MKLLISVLLLSSALQAQTLPDTPQPQLTAAAATAHRILAEPSHKTLDTPFVVFHGISLAAALADGYISQRYIKPENHCYEVNPFLGHYPSAAKTYGMTLGTWLVVTTVDWLIKRSGHDGWEVPAMGEIGIHLIGIKMTYNNCHF